eukprot:TRINITY_DN6633_c0_g1_i1.p1 TRINITY_DN6633_c0_g1~~TRINITY_DN6633_c0_g1_i1.p1  ORF type:complete len:1288 (+),score=268.88 TRINITY_DN6633_c0_g1_i1:8-3871(+)
MGDDGSMSLLQFVGLYPLLSGSSFVVAIGFAWTLFQFLWENNQTIFKTTKKFIKSEMYSKMRDTIWGYLSNTKEMRLNTLLLFGTIYFAIWMRWLSSLIDWLMNIITGGFFIDLSTLFYHHPFLTLTLLVIWIVFLSSQNFSNLVLFGIGLYSSFQDFLKSSELHSVLIPVPLPVIAVCAVHACSIILSSTVYWGSTWLVWSSHHWLLSALLSIFMYIVLPRLQEAPVAIEAVVRVDDITRMNSTVVQRTFMVRTEEDVLHVLELAKIYGKHVSMRGTTHTMGGQTIALGGFQIDMSYMKQIKWNEQRQTVSVEPGATWGELIEFLNPKGLSPVTMQSYCTFSVGGTLAVNAHGITTDFPVVQSVLSLRVITSDGKITTCSRTSNKELFSAVIGGYGLFGIITEAELSVVPNVRISMETILLKKGNFLKHYEKVLQDKNIEIKLARLDLTNPEQVFLFLYRRTNDLRIVSDLGDGPRKAGFMSQEMYKWFSNLKLAQRFRFLYESYTQTPVDWEGRQDRSLLVYESVKPFTSLIPALVKIDDTFVLQEYFVPHNLFESWVENVKPELKRNYEHCSLLNITIRYLYKDNETFLPYAKVDMFAFVMYYRIQRSSEADAELKSIHERLVTITLSLGGTFYLPYRHHYSEEQMLQSYPQIPKFFSLKRKFDPIGLFSNLWYEDYGRRFNPDEPLFPFSSLKEKEPVIQHEPKDIKIPLVSTQRVHSYKEIFKSEENRIRLKKFLRFVFNVERRESLFSLLLHAVHSPSNNTDLEIYASLLKSLEERNFQIPTTLSKLYRGYMQLLDQRKELVSETVSIIKNLGMTSFIHDYASFGDSGKIVAALQSRFNLHGQVYICHDKQRGSDMIERGLFVPHQFVPFDILNVDPNLAIPNESVDLVTMNQGLHHIPQEQLPVFLNLVWRILRPGGLFLFREHDGRPDLIPMLDVAHSVFNAVNGVSFEEEKAELRGFRPVEEWRTILTHFGFKDMYQYGLQDTDSTEDYMISFCKPPYFHDKKLNELPLIEKPANEKDIHQLTSNFYQTSGTIRRPLQTTSSFFRFPEWIVVQMAQDFGPSLNHTAFFFYPYLSWLKFYWNSLFSALLAAIEEHGFNATVMSGGFVMNVVIGFFYTLLMLQMSILTFPIRWITKSKEYDPLQLTIQTTIPVKWNMIDKRVQSKEIKQDMVEGSLYHLEIPPHRPFTEILLKFASVPEVHKVVDIGGVTSRIALKVAVSHPSQLEFVVTHQGKIIDTHIPPQHQQLYGVVTVPVGNLLALLRAASSAGVKVEQIFDFFP